MRIINCDQKSDEWHKARLWMITGTKLKDVMGSANLKLVDEIIAEKLSDQAKDFKASKEMDRWVDEEPRAVKAYEDATGEKV